MEIKAVFFDIDGTFFDHHSNQVLPETMDAIRQLKANGYKAVSYTHLDVYKRQNQCFRYFFC